MGIVAWIILGPAAGMAAKMLIPGGDRHGSGMTTLIGIAGALPAGFLATQLFHVNGTQGILNLSTWTTVTSPTAPPIARSDRREGGA